MNTPFPIDELKDWLNEKEEIFWVKMMKQKDIGSLLAIKFEGMIDFIPDIITKIDELILRDYRKN